MQTLENKGQVVKLNNLTLELKQTQNQAHNDKKALENELESLQSEFNSMQVRSNDQVNKIKVIQNQTIQLE